MRNLLGRLRRSGSRSLVEQLATLTSVGDGSTLTLDFTTGVLDPRLTFTRDGGGTYVANDGYIYGMDFATSSSLAIGTGSKSVTLTATAGVDRRYLVGQTVYISNGANNMRGPVTAYDASTQVLTINATATSGSGSFTSWTVGNASARFDYDPTTLAPRGLLIEGSATNLVTQSNGSTSVWGTGGNRTPTNNTTDLVSPDGTNNATKLVCGSAGAYASFATSISGLTGGATYTISYWIRGPVGHSPRLYAQNGTIGDVTATATTGTYNNTGWTRLTQTYTLPAATTQCLVYFLSTNIVTTGDTFYVYGFQMETGSGSSSHIPTGASQGSRAADKMSMTDISTMQWNQTAGTFALHMDVAAETNTSSFPAFMGMYTATPVRVVRFLLNNSSGTNPRIGNDTWTATPTQILASLVTRSTAPTAFKVAVSLSNTGQTINQVVNAGSATTTSGTGTMQIPTRVLWHQDPSASDSEYFPIHIRSLKYWPTALPTAQLQSITT